MIQGWLVGDAELVARMSAMPGKVNQGLVRAVTMLSLKLAQKVMADKLSGQVLKVRTGTLLRSITSRVDAGDTNVSGIVGTNVAYAHRHEYGFQGTEQVKEHLRTITQAFGHEIKAGSATFTVHAHSRKVNYPEHSFLRSALSEMEGEIKTTLEQSVRDAIKA
jgi:HK97 gp10 family phage protein